MVAFEVIRRSNDDFKTQKRTGQVAVFVGATSGIGWSTLDSMATLLVAPRLYIVGRSTSRFSTQREHLQQLNPGACITYVQAECALLAEVDRVCNEIAAVEERVDYLCLSTGYLPFAGRKMTQEGLEECFALSYHSRIRFIHKLLPLLRQSSLPRVLSVLNGGGEGQFDENDLALQEKWSFINLVHHTSTFTTLAFYHLAEQDKNIAFIHSCPGQVRTELGQKLAPAESAGIGTRLYLLMLRTSIYLYQAVVGISPDESGQRHAYILTSDALGPGIWRLNSECEQAPYSSLVETYRQTGWSDKVWAFTTHVWENALDGQALEETR